MKLQVPVSAMKEYKHSTKAGNHGDVLKHVVWLELLTETMQHQNGCLFILDTHGGNGNYNLLSNEGSYDEKGASLGIGKVLKRSNQQSETEQDPVPPPVQAYLNVLLKYNQETAFSAHKTKDSIQNYPGSPLITQRSMHPNDELVCCELNEAFSKELWELLEKTENNTSVFYKDGLAEAPIIFNKVQRRKRPFLALIDPPCVSDDESKQILETIEQLYTASNDVCFMLWIPILKQQQEQQQEQPDCHNSRMDQLYETLMDFLESHSVNAIIASLWVGNEKMIGSRAIIFNPPCDKLAQRLEPALEWLSKTMEVEPGCGKWEVNVLPSSSP